MNGQKRNQNGYHPLDSCDVRVRTACHLRRRASDRNRSGQLLHRNHGHSRNQSTSDKRPELRKRSRKKSRSRTRSRGEWKALKSEEWKLVNGTRNIRAL